MNVFFFNDTATTEIYTLSLHDALPISKAREAVRRVQLDDRPIADNPLVHSFEKVHTAEERSEEHTSELQSH